MATDLELAVATLLVKKERYDKYFDYYDNEQPLIYSREKLRDIFKNLDANFTENWTAVVVDTVHDRITLQRITIAGSAALTKRLDELMKASELASEADDVHLATIVTGEGYVIAWKDGEEGAQAEFYYNDPRITHIFYDASKPRTKRFACKWWVGDDGYRYLTLYYPDRLEYYRCNKKEEIDGALVSAENYHKSFEPYSENGAAVVANPYGEIPVFHFRRSRRKTISELKNVLTIQDSLNKLVSDMMIAAEFGAFPQRWTISQGDPGVLQNAPNKIWNIPASDGDGQPTSVGQFPATDLGNYLNAIDKKAATIGIISRTPKHYFFTQGGDPSGESLIAMEAPLNKKAQKYIDRFVTPWSDVAAFMLKLDGVIVDANAVIPHFDKPETVQPLTQALIRKASIEAGIPLIWQLRQEGYTEQEIAQLETDQAAAQAAQRETFASTMVDAKRRFDQNGDEDE